MSNMAGLDPNLVWVPPDNQLQPIQPPSPIPTPTVADISPPQPQPAPAPAPQQQGGFSFFDGFMEAVAFGYNFFLNPVGAINNVGRIVTQDSQTEVLTPSPTPISMALDAEGPIFRAANTAVAGTILLANTGGNGIRPGEDGFSIGDLGDVYRRSWEYEITPGQAIATNYAGYLEWITKAVYPEGSNALDNWIEAENAKALADPNNTRGLNHWLSGLHSEFDVDDMTQRDSAFGQGLGRWITGASDAAIYWFVGVDVLAAKAATGIYRSATTKFLATYGNAGRRGVQSLDQTKANIIAHQAGARKTTEGEIVDELVGLTKEEAAFHDLAKFSDNSMAVSNAIGAVKTREEAKQLFLALLGDRDALASLSRLRTEAADAFHMAREQRDTLASGLEGMPGGTFSGWGWHTDDAVAHFDKLADESLEEAERLKDLTSFLGRDGEQLAGIGRPTKIGGSVGRKQSKVVKGVRVQKRAGADAGYGKYSAQRQAEKARNRLARFNGSAYQHSVFNMFGRQIRVVGLRSAVDRLGTHRQSGTVNFADPNEFMEEIKSVLSTTPFLRRLAKRFARGDETALVTREMPDGTVITETIDEFRDRILGEAIAVSRKGTREKGQFLMNLERDMVLSMAYSYRMSPADMLEVAAKYSTARARVREHIAEHSWLKDGTDLVVLQQEVLTRLRNGFNLMDFNYIENVLRLSTRGSDPAGKASRGTRALVEAFDSLWRPLVLLRLGYTQRNVAEGWLRIAAATGEFPTSGAAAQSAKMFTLNAGDRLAGGGINLKRAILNRRGRRKAKREIRRNRALMQDDINKRKAVQAELKEVDRQIEMRRKLAKHTAQERVLDERTAAMTRNEGPVYNQISDEVTEAQLRLIEDADTLIYAEGEVFSLHARALPTPNAKTGEGVADAEALTRSAMGPDAEDLADQVDLYDWMTPSAKRQWDELQASQYDPETGTYLSLDAKAQADKLMLGAYARRVRQLMKDDYRIGLIDDEGRFKRLRTGTIEKLGLDDFMSGKVVAVPRSVNPQYAKVDVYGGMLDLRTGSDSGTKLDLERIRGVVTEAEDDAGQLREITIDQSLSAAQRAGKSTQAGIKFDETFRRLEDQFERTFGVNPKDVFPDRPNVPVNEWLVKDVGRLIDTILADPQLLRAVAVSSWIRRNQATLPPGFLEWATKNKLIITNKTIRGLVNKKKRLSKSIRNAEQIRNDLYDFISDTNNYPSELLHAGRLIVNNVLTDVWITPHTMDYLYGPGLYSIFDAKDTTRGYLTAHIAPGGSDISRAGMAEGRDPVVYIMPDTTDRAWVDLDEFITDVDGNMSPQLEDIIDALDIPELAIGNGTLGGLVRAMFDDGSLEVIAGENVNTTIGNVWRFVVLDNIRTGQIDNLASEDAMYKVIDVIREYGYDGLRHTSGGEGQPVFIWWSKDVEMQRLDDISDAALEYIGVERQLKNLESDLGHINTKLRPGEVAYPYSDASMTAVAGRQGEQIFQANAKLEQIITRYARERGYGGVYIDDPGTVEGYRALFTPDVSSINAGYLDSLIPGQVAQAGRGKASIADLSRTRGKQVPERRLAEGEPDSYDYPDSGSYLRALREWRESGGVTEADSIPNRARPDTSTNFLLQGLRDFDPDLYKAVTGPGSLSKTNKAKLAIWMQQGGYTHVLLPGRGKGAEPVLVSASELVADRKTGLAYLRYGAKDEVDETFTSILSKDPEYAQLLNQRDDVTRRLTTVSRSIGERQALLRDLAETVDRTRRSRFKKRRVGDSGDPEKDRVTFAGPRGEAVLETGSFRDPNEPLSGVTQSLWSSGSTTDYMIAGRIQNGHAQLQATGAYRTYSPADEKYWDAMEILVNQTIREEPIMRRIAARPRATSQQMIDQQNDEIIQELMEDPAFLQAADYGTYNIDNLPHEIDEIRETLYRWIPDQEVLNQAVRDRVDADYLTSKLAWRDDLVAIQEKELVDVRNPVRRFFNRAMNVLGTMPEDALIKAPFYRKRWNEEMQRQVNGFEESGVTSFTPAQIDAMRRQAHAYALRTTRETTYTITRLSTPAAAMAFIIPFFPAWENAVRFWSKQFVTNPSTLARYIQLWNAPNALGMVVDEDGNPVEGRRGFGGLADALISPGETYLIIPVPEWSKATLDKLPFVGLGSKGQLRIAKGALNVALQGDYPWMANAGPLVSVPVSYIAAQNPDYFEAIKGLEIGDAKIGDAIAKFFVPFGRPTASKNIIMAALEQAVPAGPGRIVTYVEGMSDTQFVSAVEEIHRDMVVDWELNGGYESGSPKPDYAEAIARAQELSALQFAGNMLSPAAPGYQSKYQVYIEEWRRILQRHLEKEQSYRDQGITPDPDERVGYDAALREFLNTYGDSYFALTQSTSGRTGIGASLGEYDILKKHGDLAGKLAESDIKGNADFAAMITSPYRGDFNESVYAWQLNRTFNNSQELIRGGERDNIQDKTEIQRGWIKWTDGLTGLEAIAEQRGTTIQRDEELSFLKKLLEADIAKQNPAWYIAKGEFETRGYIKTLENIEMILSDEAFMRAHGNEPVWVDVREWYEARSEIQEILAQRKRELGDRGSLNIKSPSNADILVAWELFIEEKKRSNIAFSEYYNRWLDYDNLYPGDPMDVIDIELDILMQQQMAMGGVQQ